MVQTTLGKNRAKYQTIEWKYQQRKEELKEKHRKQIGKWKGEAAYNEAVTTLNKRIKYFQKQMYAIDKITNQMIAISNAVTTFAGKSPRNIGKNHRNNPQFETIELAKNLFYKFGLEQGIAGNYLSEFTGLRDNKKNKKEAAIYRKRFTSSFRNKDSQNKQRWMLFKEHIARQIADSNSFIDNRKATQ